MIFPIVVLPTHDTPNNMMFIGNTLLGVNIFIKIKLYESNDIVILNNLI